MELDIDIDIDMDIETDIDLDVGIDVVVHRSCLLIPYFFFLLVLTIYLRF